MSNHERSMLPRREGRGRGRRSISPIVPRWGHNRVIQRTIREVESATYPMLEHDNYTDWSLVMKVMLQARGQWDAIEYEDTDLQDDWAALEALIKAVPKEMMHAIALKKTAKEAWDYIKSVRIGSDHVRRSKLQKLRIEYETIAFKEGEDPEDFALRLSALLGQLAEHSEPVEEQKAVEKYIQAAPPRFGYVVYTIESMLDFATLSIEDVTGRLKGADERGLSQAPPPTAPKKSKLLLTEEE